MIDTSGIDRILHHAVRFMCTLVGGYMAVSLWWTDDIQRFAIGMILVAVSDLPLRQEKKR